MSLKAINNAELKPVFEALEDAFRHCSIDYYLIGALARDVWYAKADKKFRTTRDVDFAIMAGSEREYTEFRKYLEEEKGYMQSKNNAFVVFAPDGTAIDLLPFGAITIDDGVALKNQGPTSIKVDGFMEVFKAGTEEMEIVEGYSFEVATLAAIVLLKLIAYDDRPEKRIKDARDIANILIHYFDLETELIYDQHSDLFNEEQPNHTLEAIAAIVTGRELKKITGTNQKLYDRIAGIIRTEAERQEKSEFVRNMSQETGRNIEDMVALLNYMLSGLED